MLIINTIIYISNLLMDMLFCLMNWSKDDLMLLRGLFGEWDRMSTFSIVSLRLQLTSLSRFGRVLSLSILGMFFWNLLNRWYFSKHLREGFLKFGKFWISDQFKNLHKTDTFYELFHRKYIRQTKYQQLDSISTIPAEFKVHGTTG
jgi:hypothetical protein